MKVSLRLGTFVMHAECGRLHFVHGGDAVGYGAEVARRRDEGYVPVALVVFFKFGWGEVAIKATAQLSLRRFNACFHSFLEGWWWRVGRRTAVIFLRGMQHQRLSRFRLGYSRIVVVVTVVIRPRGRLIHFNSQPCRTLNLNE